MTHPKVEELMDFVYGEIDEIGQTRIAEHLHVCAPCREKVASWRGVRQDLATWDVPLADRLAALPMPMMTTNKFRTLRWAVAASVLLASGYGLARIASPKPDLASMRAELRQEVSTELRKELAATWTGYAREQSARQKSFQHLVTQAVSRLEAQQVADGANLRKDVETVALRTQEEFDRISEFKDLPEP